MGSIMSTHFLIILIIAFLALQLIIAIWHIHRQYREKEATLRMQNTLLKQSLAHSQHMNSERIRILLSQSNSNDNHYLATLRAYIAQLYPKHYAIISNLFPALTDIDWSTILLLKLSFTNEEIVLLLNMSKRTYYKRRQIIAQRMHIHASELDEFLTQHIYE